MDVVAFLEFLPFALCSLLYAGPGAAIKRLRPLSLKVRVVWRM